MEKYAQKMKAKLFDIKAGKYIAIVHETDAKELGIFKLDRIEIFNPRTRKCIVTVADLTDSEVKENEIGLFDDVRRKLGARAKEKMIVKAVSRPKSVEFIKKKVDGNALSEEEIKAIVNDINDNKLSEIEASAFLSSVFIHGFTLNETVAMTKAIIENGSRLSLGKKPVVDKHCIGGINGRSTMIIVPIVASCGCFIPKTSSRSITSSAGTADTMEVLAPVNLSIKKIKKITSKFGGIIAWGGAIDLAPVDDKIIQLEHPLMLNPPEQIIASVMAKKASVGARYVVVDIPIGREVKIKTVEEGEEMARKFIEVGKKLGIKVEVILTNGENPNGKAFGPALEAKYVMEILEGKFFDELAEKSCRLAGILLELAGKEKKGKGMNKAKKTLLSGKALNKMREIIKAQGGRIFSSEQVKLSSLKEKIYSRSEGEIKNINVKALNDIAKIAGAPAHKKAGLMLFVDEGQKIGKGDILFEVYAENKRKLELALKAAKETKAIEMDDTIIEKIC